MARAKSESGKPVLCLLVNPFAGAGGRLAWKGTDWPLPLRLADKSPRQLPAWERARRFLEACEREGCHQRARWLAPPGPMGGPIWERPEWSPEPLRCVDPGKWPTTPEDTRECARECAGLGARLIVFVGGDGTARLVVDGARGVPVLGVPAGVKVYSAVFAESPEAAARLVRLFLEGRAGLGEREVLDIDEDAFRRGELSVRLYALAPTPVVPGLVVSGKTAHHGGSELEEMRDIAEYVRDEIARPCTLLILGPGRTVYTIAEALGVAGEKTLLGVDAYHNGRIIGRDLDEESLLSLIGRGGWRRVLIIVSPIGGQGFILGRGNQQISPRVVRAAGGPGSILVVATPTKLRALEALRVDTGDPELDREIRGYIKVLTGYNRYRLVRVK